MSFCLGLHHAAIICSSYEISKKFYSELLGFKILKETYRSERKSYKLDLEIPGGGAIELFSFEHSPQRLSHPEACGLRHLAFCVKDLEASICHLSERGVECEAIRVDELTGKRFTFFKDPDNLPLELYEF
ncbi:MAG: VOC family protein [Verrucomicrobia bacterium]|nr:VOC family protein [Verrucomicrobiota bacterium]